jgi:hypothetical protein
MRGDAKQVGEGLAHQFGVADPQQPGKYLLRKVVGVVGVTHTPQQKAPQIDGMVAKSAFG